ncbi:EAL domain-containing protein [Devosia sp. PTR5]|uniref:EAL domain-containing protein n=1 Tax=Devosia oryzisoli TaxID=2774138 RepID=A0A927FT81_9HYPH|nr:EAL domain-containing protein [Devosia oryzisoli]MBD8064254.1 EAL domain-containing protein [Devosia oryzisoli]
MQRPQYVSDAIETSAAGLHVGSYGPFRLQSAYQPVYELSAGQFDLFGFEGLVRPFREGVALAPVDFFSAVDSGDRLFVECMCRALHLRNYRQGRPRNRKLFINVNPAIYETIEVVEREFRFMFSILDKYGLTPSHLVCEVLETRAMGEATLKSLCDMLREAGCMIALDDYGTGNSGVVRYRALRPNLVKLDGALFRELAGDAARQRLLRRMVDTFHADGVPVLVEGIETRDHLALATDVGAHYFQGYGLGRPALLPAKFETKPAAVSMDTSQASASRTG